MSSGKDSEKKSDGDDGDSGSGAGAPLDLNMLLLLLRLGIVKVKPAPLMKKGDVVKGYEFVKSLGQGAFGEVWGVEKEGQKFAMKVMKLEDDSSVQAELMFSEHSHLKSPFLVEYYESFKDEERKLVYIAMELCEQGDLSGLLDKTDATKGIGLQTPRLLKIFIQLILGIHELHKNQIIHRDLKIANIFVDADDNIKIGDFGCAHVLKTKEDLTKTMIGTPAYMSPEQHNKEAYGNGADLWSLGIVMYELCMGKLPFLPDKGGRAEMEQKIMSGSFTPIPRFTHPDEIIQAIHALLSKDPKKRPNTLALLKIPMIQESARDFDLFKYFPADIAASPTLPHASKKPISISKKPVSAKRSAAAPSSPSAAAPCGLIKKKKSSASPSLLPAGSSASPSSPRASAHASSSSTSASACSSSSPLPPPASVGVPATSPSSPSSSATPRSFGAFGSPSSPTSGSPTTSSSFDTEDFPRSSCDECNTDFQEIMRAATQHQTLFTTNITYTYNGATVEIKQRMRPFEILKMTKAVSACTAADVKKAFVLEVVNGNRNRRALACLAHVMVMGFINKNIPSYFQLDSPDVSASSSPSSPPSAKSVFPSFSFDAAHPVVLTLVGFCPVLRALSITQPVLKYVQTAFKESLVYLAVRSNMMDVVELLFEMGCVVNDMRCGSSLLHAAAYFGHDYLAHYLLRRGANLFLKKAGNGGTPLSEAAESIRAALQATAARPMPAFLCAVLKGREMGELQHILYGGRVVAYRLPKMMEEKKRLAITRDWVGGWVGVNQKQALSAVEHGLGSMEAGSSGRASDGVVCLTRAVKDLCPDQCTERIPSLPGGGGGGQGFFCLLVEGYVRPGSYTEKSSTFARAYPVMHTDSASGTDTDSSTAMTAVTLVSLEFIHATDLSADRLYALLLGKGKSAN